MHNSSATVKSERKTMSSRLYSLENFDYPARWDDDSFMGVMLAEFRPKNVNPTNYDAKKLFWTEMIEAYCDYKGSGTVCISELKEVFRRNGSIPYCLQEVFDLMALDAELVEKTVFMEVPQKSLSGWAFNSLVKKPFSILKSKLIVSKDENTTFVVPSAVKRQSKLLQEHVKKTHKFNKIISMDDLMKNIDNIEGLNAEGILITLHHLSTVENKVFVDIENVDHHHHKVLMKFSEPHLPVEPITPMERSIYNLEQTEQFLIAAIDEKELNIDKVLTQVRDCLKDGKKLLAKSYLKKKHLLETEVVKNTQILENIQAMLQRIHSSNNDKDIIKTYKMGSEAIKFAFAESGINMDNVDDIIEEMREVLEEQEGIKSAISEPMRGANDPDDQELEKELQELLNEKTNHDTNAHNNNGNSPIEKKLPSIDFNNIDQELEQRLMKLRSDFSELGDNTKQPSNKQKA
ncbi:unnamed protein product [Diamesa tonsa]